MLGIALCLNERIKRHGFRRKTSDAKYGSRRILGGDIKIEDCGQKR